MQIRAISGKEVRKPYPHQDDAIKALYVLNRQDSYSTLLVLPTGGGKTYTASTWLLTHAINEGKKVLWMAHRHMLLDQALESFSNFAYLEVIPNKSTFNCRVVSGAHERADSINSKDDLLIVSKDSIWRRLTQLDEWLDGADEVYFVIDEAHHATAKTYSKVIDHLKSSGVKKLKIIGLTATPTRTFESEQHLLAKIFTDGVKNGQPFVNTNAPNVLGMVYHIGIKALINQEILSQPLFESCETQINYGGILEQLGHKALQSIQYRDKLPAELEIAISEDEARNKLIVERYKNNAARYGKTLVFTVSIAHAKILTERFIAAEIKAAYVVSGTPIDERNRIYDSYRHGDLQVIVNVNILTEGTDLPMTKTVFLTRQTTSTILMTQMIGRALRGKEAGGTKEAYIVSFIDNWQGRIMWVVPETVYYKEIIDLPIQLPPITQPPQEDEELIYISQGKILEFAKILNEAIDTTAIEAIPFIERIPVGMYAFTYESWDDDAPEGSDISDIAWQVMVYDSTKAAYEKFMDALPSLFGGLNTSDYTDDSEEFLTDNTLNRLLGECKEKFFSGEMIPPYDENDILHIFRYYAQKNVAPKFYTFAQVDREKLDISTVAQEIWNADMGERAKAKHLNDLWENGDKNIWRIFFVDKRYFLRMIEIELTKLAHPEIYKPKRITPPAVDFKTIDDLLDNLQTSSGDKSAIKHDIITALSKLEATALKNRDAEAMNKIAVYYGKIHEHAEAARCESIAQNFRSDTTSTPTPVVDFKTLDDLLDKLKSSSVNKSVIKQDIISALSKLEATALKNRDAETMNKIAVYYGKIYEYEKSEQCESIAQSFRNDTKPAQKPIAPSVKSKTGTVPDTNLTWRLDDDGTLTISGTGDMKNYSDTEFPWQNQRNSIKKVIIEAGVTKIDEWAFNCCNKLASVEIFGSLDEIARAAFKSCYRLREVKIHGTVAEIADGNGGHGAFQMCKKLASLDEILKDGIKKIGKYTFRYCESLQSVTIPPSVTDIGIQVFYGCENLKEIRYKHGLRSANKLSDGNNARLIAY